MVRLSGWTTRCGVCFITNKHIKGEKILNLWMCMMLTVKSFLQEADWRWLLWSLRGERDDGCSLVHSGTFASSWNRVMRVCLGVGQVEQKYWQLGRSLMSYLLWLSSTRGSVASTRRNTSFTDSSNHSITAASFHRLQVLATYSAVSSARAGGCLETEVRMRIFKLG